MKKLLFFLFLFSCCCLQAQNLIPNGDFELGPDTSSIGWEYLSDSNCTFLGYINGPDFWTVVYASPDRLVNQSFLCSDTTSAKSGVGYVLFADWEKGKSVLINPIQKDSLYKLGYYACFNSFRGAYSHPAQFIVKFNNGIDSLISPSFSLSQWQYYDTIFIASANATEIEIDGIFFGVGYNAAVNIDSIFLQKISSVGINNLVSTDKSIMMFPNPTTDILNIKSNNKIFNIEVYDVFGKLFFRDNKSSIDVSDFPSGIYIVKIKTDKQFFVTKVFIQ